MQPPKAIFLPQRNLKIRPESSKSFIQFNISYVILKSLIYNLYVIRMPLVYHSHVTRMCSYVIRMSLLCVRKSCVYSYAICMSSVCHSYVLVCDPYITRMYSYVTRMSLVCTRMPSVCHSYVLVCHPYVTLMYSYVIHMSLVCHPYVTCMWFHHEPFNIHLFAFNYFTSGSKINATHFLFFYLFV